METTTQTPRFARAPWRSLRVGMAVAAAAVLIAAGCGDDDDTTAAGSGGGNGGDGDMTIDITAPGDGSEVGDEFDVEVDTSVDIGEPDTGLHHVHLYYDGNTAEGEYDLMYEPTFTVDRLDPGEHTIEAVIANADHSLTDARAQATVTVGEGGGGGGSDATDGSSSGGY